MSNVTEIINQYKTTDYIRLENNQQEELSDVYAKVLEENSHISQLIKINTLKNTPSYDITANYVIEHYSVFDEPATMYCETRLILKRHIIECLKKDEPFDRNKPIGYLDNQYMYKSIGYLPQLIRTPSEVFLDEKDRIHFKTYGIDGNNKEESRGIAENVSTSMHLMESILFAILNPNEVEKVIETAPKIETIKTNKKRKSIISKQPVKVQRVLVINLKGYKRYVKTKGKEFTRFTNVWGVIGHIRHYKNGKKIFIKPYEKGKDRNKGMLDKKDRKIVNVDIKNLDLLTEGL